MGDLLAKGRSWLGDKRHSNLTHTVTYRRKVGEGFVSVSLQATIGRTPFEQFDSMERITRHEARDYIIRTADLVLASQAATPDANTDQIVETIGGVSMVFEVMALPAEPPFKWCDPAHETVRIHTKAIGADE